MKEMSPINYYMIGMDDHTAWLFSDKPKDGDASWAGDWLEWHQEMKIAQSFSPVKYECNVQYHGNRIKFYNDRPVDVVYCAKCGAYMSVNEAILADLKKYRCNNCKHLLG